MITQERLVSFLLRIGLATVFLYAAIASFMDPDTWASFFPLFMREMMPQKTLLFVFSIYELLLVLFLLLEKQVFYVAILSALTMFGIVAVNATGMDVVFRDIAIGFSALALAMLYKK